MVTPLNDNISASKQDIYNLTKKQIKMALHVIYGWKDLVGNKVWYSSVWNSTVLSCAHIYLWNSDCSLK